MSETTNVRRTVREAIEIEAAAERVWHALVRRDETPRWLGVGATLEARLGAECSATDLRGERFAGAVAELAATRRIVARAEPGGELAIELEPRRSGTLVRCVRTLDVPRADADEFANATAREWRLALLALRLHVESRGANGVVRASAWSQARGASGRTAAWHALFGAERFVLAGSVDQLQRRDGFAVTLPGGVELSGRASIVEPGAQFVGDAAKGELLALSALGGARGTLLDAAWFGARRPKADLDALASTWHAALAACTDRTASTGG
jgi:uncharacterized protein YndB with AHSA1/START domain